MKRLSEQENFFSFACIFEGALLLVALLLGWLTDVAPLAALRFDEQGLVLGVAGTVPLFLLLLAMAQLDIAGLQNIRKLLLETLGTTLQRHQWPDLLLLATIAGVSEEALFRGFLQPWLESAWGWVAGLIASNVLFGLVHAVTPMYAVLAGLVGLYLGLSLDFGEQRNLLTPMLIHGLYDFLAFLAILRAFAKEQGAI